MTVKGLGYVFPGATFPHQFMQVTTQLAIFLDNRPGMLADVCEALAEAGINIYALTVSDTVDHSVIRMVVSDARKALLIFEERGTLVVESDVLMIEAPNHPGLLAQVSRQLATASVNIEYCYCASPAEAPTGLLVFRVSDAAKALKVLQSAEQVGSTGARKSSRRKS